MSPSLRGVRAEDAIRAFERAGGIRRSGKGDHVNIKMPNGMVVTLKAVGEVKTGLLKAAIRKAGLTETRFRGYLR